MQKITPFIWFQGQAEEAMNFYVSVFKDSRITHIERYTGDQGIPDEQQLKGKVLTGVFQLQGQQFMCLDGGPVFQPTAAVSFMVRCNDQAELDGIWERLLEGGTPMQCGWITDRFSVTWQIVPAALDEMMSDSSAAPAQKQALMEAMMPMVKLDEARLREAFAAAR